VFGIPETLSQVVGHALLITGFVFVMMLVIEYVNVQTSGRLSAGLIRSPWRQYLLASLLGATPGCLGAFTVVGLYSHRIVGFGALVAVLIATSGDEAYLMFSLFPRTAAGITVILFAVGLGAGWLTDHLFPHGPRIHEDEHPLPLHETDRCRCFELRAIPGQLRDLRLPRALLILILGSFLGVLLWGAVGPTTWNWVRITLLAGVLFGLFVVLTVPEHFLEEHLWAHVLKQHVPRIFLWTFGALLATHLLAGFVDVEHWIRDNAPVVLVVAVLVGLIPESGPHMVFVTLYATGSLPLGILLANSIVQDGHGALPLLAVSRTGFLAAKAVNLAVALVLGGVALLLFHG
jgi:hypothetical protein